MNKINPNLIYIIAFVFIFVFAMALTGCSAEEEKPTDATGPWYGEAGDATFMAVTTEDEITIHIVNDDAKALYWQGSFGVETLNEGDDIKSVADAEALESSIMGSTEDSKRFVFKDGALTFDFGIMGVTQTVKLKK